MKRILALMLVLVMLFGLCACKKEAVEEEKEENGTVEPTPDPAPAPDDPDDPDDPVPDPELVKTAMKLPRISLIEVAQIKDPGRKMYGFSDAMFMEVDGADKLVTLSGEDKLGLSLDYAKTEELGGGLYVIVEAKEESSINDMTVISDFDAVNLDKVGLADIEGNLLIPFEASQIERLEEGSRFLTVCYATEKILMEGEHLFKTDGSHYAGYCKIYDTVAKQFVPNVNITKADEYDSLFGTGSSFGLKSAGITKVYDANGQVMLETACEVQAESGVYCEKNDEKGGWVFYNDTMQQMSVSASEAYVIPGSGEYLAVTRDRQYVVHNLAGELVLDMPFDRIESEQDGIFIVTQDNKYGLVSLEGKEILPCEYSDLNYMNYGIYDGRTDEGYCIVTELGEVLLSGMGAWPMDMAINDANHMLYIYKDGEYSLEAEYVSVIDNANAVVKVSNDDGYGLYDLLSGRELLEQKYDEINFAADHVWALRDNIWYVYEIKEVVQK